MSITQPATSAPVAKQRTGSRLLPILVAVVGTVAVWFVAHSVFNVDLKAKTGNTVAAVTLPSVIVVTLVVGLLAWALLAVLERITGAARAVWTTIAVLFFVVSLLGPAGAVGNSAKVGLACMHIVAALVIIPGLGRTARRR
jgi:hypothetical protein